MATKNRDLYKIESHRPFPLSAKQALEKHAEEVEYSDGDSWIAYVDSLPPDEVFERFELELVRDDEPEEVWEAYGNEIKIYEDRVIHERDGEIDIKLEDAKRKARENDDFERKQ